MEVWKDIVGYEGLYEVSDCGNIRNTKTKLILKPHNSHGYMRICLCVLQDKRSYFIHRLVAIAFIPNNDSLPFINHKDENKLNNNVSNLEWCTNKYNLNYGTVQQRRASAISMIVIQKSKNGENIKTYQSAYQAQRETGINHSHITGCANGKRKSAGGYIWNKA